MKQLMLVQLLNMKRLEEEGESELGKVKEESNVYLSSCFALTPSEHNMH